MAKSSLGKKVALSSIKSLTLYRDALTAARRTEAIPQMTCLGTACDNFQPEVMQCLNMGDDGTGGVQWRCDADVPQGFRLGKVQVSCEGWSRPGDKNVLQGSCGVEYNLYQTPSALSLEPRIPRASLIDTVVDKFFTLLFWFILLTILYSLLRSFLSHFYGRTLPHPSSFFPWSGPGGGGGRGGGGGGGGGEGGGGGPPGPGGGGGSPPPPYTKDDPSSPFESGAQRGSGPGFWTGIAAGAAGGYLASQLAPGSSQDAEGSASRRRTLRAEVREVDEPSSSSSGGMRRAVGFGGSTTR